MDDPEFWNRVSEAAETLKISPTTVRVWKHRGQVAESKKLAIHNALAATAKPIPLDELLKIREASAS